MDVSSSQVHSKRRPSLSLPLQRIKLCIIRSPYLGSGPIHDLLCRPSTFLSVRSATTLPISILSFHFSTKMHDPNWPPSVTEIQKKTSDELQYDRRNRAHWCKENLFVTAAIETFYHDIWTGTSSSRYNYLLLFSKSRAEWFTYRCPEYLNSSINRTFGNSGSAYYTEMKEIRSSRFLTKPDKILLTYVALLPNGQTNKNIPQTDKCRSDNT